MVSVEKIVRKARFAMTKGHCCIQHSPPVGPGQSTGGGPGSEGLRSTEDLAFYNIRDRLKNHLCCVFFCVLLCVL